MNKAELPTAFLAASSDVGRFNQSVESQILPASVRVTFRLTPKEHADLKHMSEGVSMSAYIRKSVFGDNAVRRKRRSHVPVKDQESLAQVLALLGQTRIANNLNQLAHHANCGSLNVDEVTKQKINEAYEHVCNMRGSLIRALGLIENQ